MRAWEQLGWQVARLARRLHLPPWLVDYSAMRAYELPRLPAAALPPAFSVRRVADADVDALAVCRAMRVVPAGAALFRRRLAGGSWCAGLWHGTELIAYAWVHPHENVREDRDQYHMPLGADGAYIYDTFIQPAWRGQGLYALLLAALQWAGATAGLTRFFLTVDAANARSLRAHEKAGAQWCETVQYLCCAGITRHAAQWRGGRYAQWSRYGCARTFNSRAMR